VSVARLEIPKEGTAFDFARLATEHTVVGGRTTVPVLILAGLVVAKMHADDYDDEFVVSQMFT
jgi:hypothetical protein